MGKDNDRERLKRTRPKTDAQLLRYIREFFGYSIPTVNIKGRRECRAHCAPFSWVSDLFFDRVGDSVTWAPRGGGKTLLASIQAVLEGAHKPGISARILGGSQKQSDQMYGHLKPMLEMEFYHIVKGEVLQQATRLLSGGDIETLAASSKQVMGPHVPRLYYDEADEIDPQVMENATPMSQSLVRDGKTIYESRITTLSTYHHPYGQMAATWENAEKEGIALYHWCIFEILQRCPPDYNCKRCNLWDDCHGIAKTECNGYYTIKDARKQKKRLTPDGWKSFFLCEKPYAGGVFYRNYNEDIHVARAGQLKYNPDLPLFRSFDWGSNPPTRVVWCQVDSRHPGNPNVMVDDIDAIARVIDEYQCQSAAASSQAQEVLKYHRERGYGPVTRDTCDPAGKSFVAEFNKAGIYPWGRGESGRRLNVRKEGQEIIRQKLLSAAGKSTLIIAPRCALLRAEFRSCHYPEHKQGQPSPEDHVKADDHGLDALRYLLASRFPLMEWQIQR